MSYSCSSSAVIFQIKVRFGTGHNNGFFEILSELFHQQILNLEPYLH